VFETLIYFAFERPFERLRASVRRRRSSRSAVQVVAGYDGRRRVMTR